MADLYKDQFFDSEHKPTINKDYLQGQLNVIDDLVGLPLILKQYKLPEQQ